jgi:hypothetical protein
LVQFGADVGLQLTPQGLAERFTQVSGDFLQALFEVALVQVVVADPVAVPLLERFRALNLEESTLVHLPDTLACWFRGCGGAKKGKGSNAAFKLHVRLEMLRGQLTCSSLLDGRQTDTRTPLRDRWTQEGTLNIRDRGFFDAQRWQQEARHGEYTLTSFKNKVTLYDREGQVLDLVAALEAGSDQGEMEVLVGANWHLPMRLLFRTGPYQGEGRTARKAAQRGPSPWQQVLAGYLPISRLDDRTHDRPL